MVQGFDEVREQLERILASDAFATSARHSRLLRYLVERTLAGEGDQLKEYVLGTEVFDRADSYDPRLDSIVRVEVRRLRSRLEEYYRGPGEADPVVITIPRGSYVPLFEERRLSAAIPLLPVAEVRPRRALSPLVMIATALSVAMVILSASLITNYKRNPAEAATVPGLAVLPFEHFSTNERDVLLVAQLTDAVTAAIAKLGTVAVSSRTTAARYTGRQQSLIEIAKALDVDFVVEASAVFQGDALHVSARLVDGRLDRKVWVGEYVVDRTDISATAQKIASDAAGAAVARSLVAPE